MSFYFNRSLWHKGKKYYRHQNEFTALCCFSYLVFGSLQIFCCRTVHNGFLRTSRWKVFVVRRTISSLEHQRVFHSKIWPCFQFALRWGWGLYETYKKLSTSFSFFFVPYALEQQLVYLCPASKGPLEHKASMRSDVRPFSCTLSSSPLQPWTLENAKQEKREPAKERGFAMLKSIGAFCPWLAAKEGRAFLLWKESL